jgi:hypothetical protein
VIGILLALLVGATLLAILSWSDISSWFHTNTTRVSQYGEIIKERLASGNYKVVAGIFDKRNNRTANTTWTAREIDESLRNKFTGSNQIVVDV